MDPFPGILYYYKDSLTAMGTIIQLPVYSCAPSVDVPLL